MKLDYSKIPESAMESLTAYIETGRPLGGCLAAVVSNDLLGAFKRADDAHLEAMFHIVAWIANKVPMMAWGTRDNYKNWITLGGMKGLVEFQQ